MTANEGAKSQRRMVVCPKHGLTYDASKRGGCERCIREWERQRSPGKGGLPTAVKVLGLVLVAAGLYVFFTRSPTEEGPAAGAAPATAQPVAGAGPGVAEEGTERALRQIVAAVPEVLELGRQDTERLLAATDDLEGQRQDWEFWALEWDARLQPLADQLPPPPDPRESPALGLAYQDVERLVAELRAVPQATNEGVPDKAKVEQQLAAAEQALQRAVIDLARLGR